ITAPLDVDQISSLIILASSVIAQHGILSPSVGLAKMRKESLEKAGSYSYTTCHKLFQCRQANLILI
ncbi:hypothetical protein KI387_033995, partial [Taxus chinensis]